MMKTRLSIWISQSIIAHAANVSWLARRAAGRQLKMLWAFCVLWFYVKAGCVVFEYAMRCNRCARICHSMQVDFHQNYLVKIKVVGLAANWQSLGFKKVFLCCSVVWYGPIIDYINDVPAINYNWCCLCVTTKANHSSFLL